MNEKTDFFNVGSEEVEEKDNNIPQIIRLQEIINDTPQIPNPNKVIMRVLHTRTEIKIYPNGTTFQSSRSWFEDKHYEVKPKPKKELVKAKQVSLQQKEEY